jgi:predicted GIY-YIG superfamily endonuclease
MTWTAYVLCSETRDVTYVGITVDLERRLAQHNGEQKGGARSTRSGRPWRIGADYGPYEDRSEAQRAEYRLKQLRGAERLSWDGVVPDPDEPAQEDSASSVRESSASSPRARK